MDTLPLSFFRTNSFTHSAILHKLLLARRFCEYVFFQKTESAVLEFVKNFSLQDQLNPPDHEFLTGFWQKYQPVLTSDTFYSAFDSLSKELDTLPRLVLYSPIYLPDDHRNKIALWVQKELQPAPLVEFKVKPELIGGCGLSWNNSYREYSILSAIHASREKLKSLVTSYDTQHS